MEDRIALLETYAAAIRGQRDSALEAHAGTQAHLSVANKTIAARDVRITELEAELAAAKETKNGAKTRK